MDLGNLVKTIMYHLLIKWMICIDYRDQFPIMSALVYMMYTRYDFQDTNLVKFDFIVLWK